ncbi:hypothetical protein E2980_21975 [Cohnella luojiensis]|uniref:YhfM-like domain-containing protein n=2 Tax=Cohnella luojiensis TaxID=652876 RepID=A0A4Y8LPL3_9BACL|nr:hypothetical protein E2980_21975 [Cohnella luojiensis]
MSLKRKRGVILMLAALIGLSSYFYVFRVTADEVVVYRMIDFNSEGQYSKLVFTDREAIKAFTYAVRFADKQPGIVDIAAPDYRFYLGGKGYYLWLDERYAKGTLMKPPNTGTIYTIGKSTTSKLKKIIGVGK